MKKCCNIAVFIFSFILIEECASANINSFRDPAFEETRFQRILVVAQFVDLESRTNAECTFAARLAGDSVESMPSIRILIPTRTYKDEEFFEVLSENKIDGVLIVTLSDAYSDEAYVPPFSETHGQATLSGSIVTYSGHTHNYGGYYVSKPRIRCELRLYDATTANMAWFATSFTRGNTYATFDTLINSLADTAARRLRKDGLLR